MFRQEPRWGHFLRSVLSSNSPHRGHGQGPARSLSVSQGLDKLGPSGVSALPMRVWAPSGFCVPFITVLRGDSLCSLSRRCASPRQNRAGISEGETEAGRALSLPKAARKSGRAVTRAQGAQVHQACPHGKDSALLCAVVTTSVEMCRGGVRRPRFANGDTTTEVR